MKLGPKQVFTDSLFHLNNDHLSPNVKTIHEELIGQSASINTLVYRGNHIHPLYVPKLASQIGLLEKESTVNGPAYFSYGLLSRIDPNNKHTHLWDAFGFNDKFAAQELKYLIENDRLPAFSIVYFSDNDKKVHKEGVKETKGIEEADKQLQELFNSYPTWDDALKDTVWIAMGDCGQTDVGENKNEALIDLRKLLNDYKIHKISEPIQQSDQIVLGLNERMSFIYLLDETKTLEEIAAVLMNDHRIDHIAWKKRDLVKVIAPGQNGSLSFKPNGEFTDPYGQTWTIIGNIDLLDVSINKENEITYRNYPDGLARLFSSFYSHSGKYLVVNAKPGFEFIGEGSPTHVGGAGHGSLHKQDSYFPLIVAGTNETPKHERIVDIKEWILRILNQKEQPEAGNK